MLSVVIPALDEAPLLRETLLPQLFAQEGVDLQVIVAPADSTDETANLGGTFDVETAPSGRGRARQMNAGARSARGEHLLFLHADSQLRSRSLLRGALEAMAGTTRCAGHFRLRFLDGRRRLAYRYHASKTTLNRPETINGDQGMMISRGFFEELGGYPERFEFFEDQLFAARVFERGSWILLPGELGTSTRRFEREGMFPRMAATAITMAMHRNRFEEFFAEIPALYEPHGECGRLDFLAFSDALESLFERQGRERARELRRGAGAYVRENVWQLAHLADLLVWRRAGGPCLGFYDRHVAKRLNCRLADRTATAVMLAWYGLARAWYRLRAGQAPGARGTPLTRRRIRGTPVADPPRLVITSASG